MNTTSTQMQMGSTMIAQIADPQLRSVLISTAENVEAMLKMGKIIPATKLVGRLPYGLTVEVTLDYKGKEKPTVFTFVYYVDRTKLASWLLEHQDLTEGILSFVGKGIEITIPPGQDPIKQAQKTGFSIEGADGERDWLWQDNSNPITFKAHKNVFGGKEWECFYIE